MTVLDARSAAWRMDTVLERLAGSWVITRQISNGARLAGEAVFSPADGGALAYHETGRLRLPDGTEFQAERRYRFEPTPQGFDVFFAGRDTYLFHAIALHGAGDVLVGEGLHPCRADLYRSRYAFGPGEAFSIVHVVKGVRHDYTMTTAYRRP